MLQAFQLSLCSFQLVVRSIRRSITARLRVGIDSHLSHLDISLHTAIGSALSELLHIFTSVTDRSVRSRRRAPHFALPAVGNPHPLLILLPPFGLVKLCGLYTIVAGLPRLSLCNLRQATSHQRLIIWKHNNNYGWPRETLTLLWLPFTFFSTLVLFSIASLICLFLGSPISSACRTSTGVLSLLLFRLSSCPWWIRCPLRVIPLDSVHNGICVCFRFRQKPVQQYVCSI